MLLAFLLALDLLIWHGTRGAVAYYVITCNVHSCGYSISYVALYIANLVLLAIFGTGAEGLVLHFKNLWVSYQNLVGLISHSDTCLQPIRLQHLLQL